MTEELKLSDRDWKLFVIGEVFSIRSSRSAVDKSTAVPGDSCPYITRSDASNGLSSFVARDQGHKAQVEEGNVITLGLDTSSVFYQPYDFHTGQNIHILTFPSINKHTAMFVIALLKLQLQKFSWGSNGATLGRLKRARIMLPVVLDGSPDWDFMYSFTTCSINNVVHDDVSPCEVKMTNAESLSDREWRPFYLGDIFSMKHGKSLPSDVDEGHVPYIAAAKTRNGVRGFVDAKPHNNGGCLGVVRNGDGGAGYAFYHQYPACYSQDMEILRFTDPTLQSRNLYLFISLMIRMQRGKYNHGYKFNTLRIKRQRIMLPVDSNGNIDWDFMESYMSVSMEARKEA